ncbi:MAG TPA: hypothetical protein VNX46_11990, partial [Candidatus Acidoferrum sp.]|nr:hypothetical protein [Candidatus Acidoferrum sp.]
DGIDPRSKALSDAFDSLQQSRLIGRLNPDLVVYSINEALMLRYKKYIAPKIGDQESLIKQLAQQVESKLPTAS